MSGDFLEVYSKWAAAGLQHVLGRQEGGRESVPIRASVMVEDSSGNCKRFGGLACQGIFAPLT